MTKQEAIAHFGSVRELADAMTRAGWRISQPAIYQWVEIPPLRQMQIQRLTRGALKADESISTPTSRGKKTA